MSHDSKYPQRHLDRGLSYSAIKQIYVSPKHYEHRYIKGNYPPESDAMRIGTAVHCLVLQPELFDEKIAIGPNIGRNTIKWKEFAASNIGRSLIKEKDFELAKAMAAEIKQHPIMAQILAMPDKEVEKTFRWRDPSTGVPLQAIPDLVCSGGRLAIDIKTTSDITDFDRSVGKYHYGIQQAIYTDVLVGNGHEIERFWFCVVTSTEPIICEIHALPEESVAASRLAYQRCCWLFDACVKAGRWPGGRKGIVKSSIKPWALREMEDKINEEYE